MPDRAGRVTIEPEVDVLDGKIRSKNQVVTAAAAHDGRIIANAEFQTCGAFGPSAPQPSYEFGFTLEGHGGGKWKIEIRKAKLELYFRISNFEFRFSSFDFRLRSRVWTASLRSSRKASAAIQRALGESKARIA